MGYTVKPATASVAFGISGIGELASGYFQNAKKLSTYYAALDDGRLPVERGYELDDDDRLRRFVITQLMCNFRLDKAAVEERFGVDFDTYFAAALAQLDELEAAGFVERGAGELAITPRGRLFVRNAAMPFDRYLTAKLAAAAEKPVFSRTV
jgi:oxygen-independent coproporphyrinogen-3 oxidase